jgi:hypothetical protein
VSWGGLLERCPGDFVVSLLSELMPLSYQGENAFCETSHITNSSYNLIRGRAAATWDSQLVSSCSPVHLLPRPRCICSIAQLHQHDIAASTFSLRIRSHRYSIGRPALMDKRDSHSGGFIASRSSSPGGQGERKRKVGSRDCSKASIVCSRTPRHRRLPPAASA